MPVETSSAADAATVLDRAGEETLELFRENDGYNQFLFESLCAMAGRPLAGRVLEVGCGIGNLTRQILARPGVTFVRAIDLDPAYVERVAREIPDARLSVAAAAAEEYCPAEHRTDEGGFDFVVSSNVLEHIEDHVHAARNIHNMLRPGGIALILVPAHPWLYSELDRRLSHFRRYRRRDVRGLATAAGLAATRVRYFNPLGALGWWLNGKVLRRAALPSGQLALYSRWAIPVSKLLDRLCIVPFGVSVLGALVRAEDCSSGA